ncbi:DNA-directed DNA polymerase [Apophysomyces ossiformis]|uniref:DNA-directed DNA polymerase n=1 Tax=Apophysomyces ossiformis TaxID=679940 RepID=A0A8H7BX89_9FUNG|nr:DNA-directed DNA polymerase [Apophysomyces ossiformis]
MATTTLQLYWDLASFDPNVRQTAAQSLIRSLAEFQSTHEQTLENKEDVADTEEKLDALCASDVSYAVRRLLRGLPSSRQGARQGFSLALTELLAIMDIVSAKLVLDLLFQYTERTGAMSGEEQRDMLFGRLFGLMSIVASGMMTRATTTIEDINRILESLANMVETKSYLSEVCHHVVINMLPHLKSTGYKKEAVEKILELFMKETISTVDQLNLALSIQQQLPEVDLSTQFSGWKSSNVLDSVNLARLAVILKAAPLEDQESQTEWKPQLHSVWDRLLAVYFEPSGAVLTNGIENGVERPKKKQKAAKKADVPKVAPFQEFWTVTVDQTMFETNATHGRKFWGFQLVEKALPRLSPEQMPLIFTENFMRTFINNLSSDVRYLNKAARHTAGVLQHVAENNKQVGFALITQLLGKHGHQHFDRITKTKTVENLLPTMDEEGINSYLEYLAEMFIKSEATSDDSKQSDSRREWALSQMAMLITNTKIPKEEEWITKLVRFLMVYAFFDCKVASAKGSFFENFRQPAPALSDSVQKFCKERFQAVLVALSKLPPTEKVKEMSGSVLKTRRLNGFTNDGELWVYRVYQVYEKLEKDGKKFESLIKLSRESQKQNKKAAEVVEKLREKLQKDNQENSHDSLERGFEILIVNMMLHLLIDEEEAQAVLGDLLDCYDKTFSKAKPKAKKSKKNASTEETESQPEPVEVIVDILVSFLTNPSPVLKNLAEQVFEIFSHQITRQSLQMLLNILAASENKSGSEELFGEEESEEEEDDDVEMLEMDSDVEMIDDEEGEVDEELRQKVEEAMKSEGLLPGENDDEEADLDDEAMAAFDEKLAEVFKQKKIESKEKKDMQQNIVHFKNNVMDLVAIYVRKNPTNPLILDTIVPLLNVIRSTPAKSVTSQFVEKVTAFLKNKLTKLPEYPKEHDDTIFEIMQSVHDFATQSSSKELSEMCNQLALFLRKCIVGGADLELNDDVPAKTKEELNKMIAIYSSSLKLYMTKKSTHFPPSMIASLVQRFPHSTWPLMDSLVTYINPSETANHYRQSMACQWIMLMVQRSVGKKSEEYNQLFAQLAPKIAKQVEQTIEKSMKEEAKGTLDYDSMRNFVRFIVTMVRLHRKVLDNDVKALNKAWNAELIASITSNDKYNKPAIQTTCKQIANLLKN